jgi:neutral ceramidase
MAVGTLVAGYGRQCITPPPGTYLAGYASRQEPAQGIHDDLYVRAVALGEGEARVLLLAIDAIGLELGQMAELKQTLTVRTGVAPEAILANFSHTHAGPILSRRNEERFDPGYYARFVAGCEEAAVQALDDLSAAALHVGTAPADIGCNRRERVASGEVILGVNPAGATIQEVAVWRLARARGADIVLYSLPVHGTTLGGENLLISAEWMGVATSRIEALRPDLRAVFLQGCAGDQNPYRNPRTFEMLEAHGVTVARAVLGALSEARPVASTPLISATRCAPLPLEGGGVGECPLHGVRMGEGLMVGLAGEAFVEYALHARATSRAASTMALGYTDGGVGYLPTAAAYVEGGYETTAYRYSALGRSWTPGLEAVLKGEIEAVLAELAG